MRILAVDFDGVIHDHKNPVKGRRMGAPIEGAVVALRQLSRNNKIIIHTVWGDEKGRKTIADWMKYYEIPFHEITNIKPQADCYLDDKAIHFTNWESFIQLQHG